MTTEIVVMTKAPIEGRVKTRLIPAIGATAATELHIAMTRETIQRAQQSGLPVHVSLDGDTDSSFAQEIRSLDVRVEAQAQGDLGSRLWSAVRPSGKTLFLGTDCILFEPSWLQQASHAVEAVSIGPAEDGGYWLIGLDMTSVDLRPVLFQDIPWSTGAVCVETVDRLQQRDQAIHWLPKLYDIDTINELKRLQRDPSCPEGVRQAVNATVLTGR